MKSEIIAEIFKMILNQIEEREKWFRSWF